MTFAGADADSSILAIVAREQSLFQNAGEDHLVQQFPPRSPLPLALHLSAKAVNYPP